MNSTSYTRWLVLALVSGCLSPVVGCSVTRKSASLDSTSRMPFFNMELAPKRKEPAPETQRIRWDQTAAVETEPALLIANAPPADNKSWWQRLTGSEKKAAVPLPRTDLVTPVQATQPVVKLPTNDVPVEF